MSLMIKKYARRICCINDQLYYYRQHDNQVYGGILNFSEQIVNFRARRMLKLIDLLKEEKTGRLISGIEEKSYFEDIASFYKLLAREKLRLWDIMTPALPMRLKLKLLVYRKFSFVAPWLVKIKWLLDRTL